LGGFHLADDDGTGVDETLDGECGGVLFGVKVVVGAVSAAAACACYVVDVFDPETDLLKSDMNVI
jgi:hypothetical protein